MRAAAPTNVLAAPIRVWFVAFALFSTAGTSWALASPLMSAPDEPSHAIYAAAVVRGQFRGTDIVNRADEPGEINSVVTLVEVPTSYATLKELPNCYAFRSQITADCAPHVESAPKPAVTSTAAGRYPPLYYLLIGWPSLLPMEPTAAIYGMRIVSACLSAALYALGVVGAFLLGRSAWFALGVALASTPMALFLAGTINPSGIEIAAAFALWWMGLALLDARVEITNPAVVGTATSTAALSVSRPLSLLFTALIVVTLLALVATRQRIRDLMRNRRVWAAGGLAGAVASATLIWIVATDAIGSFSGSPVPGLTATEAAQISYDLTGNRYEQMIGNFGWLDTPIPRSARLLWSWGLLVLGVLALLFGTWRRRTALVAMAVITVALPVVAEMRSAQEISFAWQGRYSLPYAVGIPISSAWMLARGRRLRGAVEVVGALFITSLAAVAHLLAYAGALRRYEVGYPAPLLSVLGDGAWEPPIGSLGGLAGFSLAVVGFLLLVIVFGGPLHRRLSGNFRPVHALMPGSGEVHRDQRQTADREGDELYGFPWSSEGRQREEEGRRKGRDAKEQSEGRGSQRPKAGH